MRRSIAVWTAVVVAACAVGVRADETKPADDATAITGQCNCGHVKYEVAGAVRECNYCNCRDCQRATGTFKSPFVVVKRDAFKLTAGELTEFKAKSGAKCNRHGVWFFCPKCGSQICWKDNRGKQVDIFAGTLDNPKVFKPKE